jgi:hypothetical protein
MKFILYIDLGNGKFYFGKAPCVTFTSDISTALLFTDEAKALDVQMFIMNLYNITTLLQRMPGSNPDN